MEVQEWLLTLSGYGAASVLAVYAAFQRRRFHATQVDVTTGLPVRSAFYQRGQSALHRGGRTLVLLDLDRFKAVNDRHGYDVGDAVLAVTGSRIQSVLPPGAVAGRLGGDEFAIVLNTPTMGAAQKQLEKLVEAIAASINLSTLIDTFHLAPRRTTTVIHVGVSAGALYLGQTHTPVLSGCLQIAAELMVTAKRAQGGYRLAYADAADPRITSGVQGRPQVRARDLAGRAAHRGSVHPRNGGTKS